MEEKKEGIFDEVKEKAEISQTEKAIRSARGKKSRAAGGRFELKVRNYLENLGWIIVKWPNNLEKLEDKVD